MSAAIEQLRDEFGVTTTQAILPLSLYVFALGLGPVVGGPLSETVGRLPVYMGGLIGGTLFTLGAGLSHSFAGLNILRFLAGFCFAPSLAIATGTINEIYKPVKRGLPSTLFILTPFLGPGLALVRSCDPLKRFRQECMLTDHIDLSWGLSLSIERAGDGRNMRYCSSVLLAYC